MDLAAYRESPPEQARINGLLAVLPGGRGSVLEVGARDGYISRKLSARFESVTALDLELPAFGFERVIPVKGDVAALQFPDRSFDTVVCTEVLEHLDPAVLEKACREILRVARYDIVIGVPYRQDLRLARSRCGFCGGKLPAWGHRSSFDERRIRQLFHPAVPVSMTFISRRERTNALSALLMDLGGNPWGAYDEGDPCFHCGTPFVHAAGRRALWQRVCSGAAARLDRVQNALGPRRAAWVHVVFRR